MQTLRASRYVKRPYFKWWRAGRYLNKSPHGINKFRMKFARYATPCTNTEAFGRSWIWQIVFKLHAFYYFYVGTMRWCEMYRMLNMQSGIYGLKSDDYKLLIQFLMNTELKLLYPLHRWLCVDYLEK